jgi:hypothetical protein
MFSRNTLHASRLTLAFGGLVIAAAASAADVQSQAQELLTGGHQTREATITESHLTMGPTEDVQQQAARLLRGSPSQETNASASTRLAFRTADVKQLAQHGRFSSAQEIARQLVLGVVGEQ